MTLTEHQIEVAAREPEELNGWGLLCSIRLYRRGMENSPFRTNEERECIDRLLECVLHAHPELRDAEEAIAHALEQEQPE